MAFYIACVVIATAPIYFAAVHRMAASSTGVGVAVLCGGHDAGVYPFSMGKSAV
jgi:hypothetical protein